VAKLARKTEQRGLIGQRDGVDHLEVLAPGVAGGLAQREFEQHAIKTADSLHARQHGRRLIFVSA
jgi:hypothetical protein